MLASIRVECATEQEALLACARMLVVSERLGYEGVGGTAPSVGDVFVLPWQAVWFNWDAVPQEDDDE